MEHWFGKAWATGPRRVFVVVSFFNIIHSKHVISIIKKSSICILCSVIKHSEKENSLLPDDLLSRENKDVFQI